MTVDPTQNIHTIKVIPRYTPSSVLTLRIVDSTLGITTDVTPSYTIGGDYKLALVFAYIFTNETSYSLTLTDNTTTEIVYRGLVLATSQVAQKYKLTTNVYNWATT